MMLNLLIVFTVWIYNVNAQAFEIQQIRLVGGPTNNAGRVEIRINGTWGTVCDDQWDSLDAAVVCRVLGYKFGGNAYSKAKYGPGSGIIHLDDVSCNGDEEKLEDCKMTRNTNACSHAEDAGVECDNTNQPPSATSTPGPATTRKTEPVGDKCPSGQKNQYVQLVNSKGITGVGYVEIRNPADQNSNWGSMCDDMIDENVAKIICGSLCFNTTWARPGAIIKDLGQPRFPIVLDDVVCTGHETQIQDCQHRPWGQSNCNDKTEVAKVTCVDLKSAPVDPPIPVLQCRQGYLIALFSRARDSALEEKHLSIGKPIIGQCNLKKETDQNYVTIRIPFEECGTVATTNKTHIIYSNVIKYDYTELEGSIARLNVYMVQVSCEMPRNYSADRNMEPLTQTVTKKAEGVFVINMQFYKNNSFTKQVTQYPVRMTLGEWLNVAIILESVDSRLKLVVPDCIATPTADRNNPINVPLFLDKCSKESSLGFFPLTKEKFGFRYQSFVFVNYPEVFIHCGAFVCLATETGAECDRSCRNNKATTKGRRRRRGVASAHSKFWINSGPVYIYKNRYPSITTEDDHVSQLNTTQRTIRPDRTTITPNQATTKTNYNRTTDRMTKTIPTTRQPPEQTVTKPSILPAKEFDNLMKVKNSVLQTKAKSNRLDASVFVILVASVIKLLTNWL